MRIRASTKMAETVEAVFVNGKQVKMPFEFDTEEGWCDAYIPKIFDDVQFVSDNTTVKELTNNNEGKFEFELIRLTGNVSVVFKNKEEKNNE